MYNFFEDKLNKYIPNKNKDKRGFFLFNPPTGSGKTTAVINYIDNLLNQPNTPKILFITNLKENLDKPFSELNKKNNSNRVIRLLSIEDELFILCEKKLWKEPKSYRFKYFGAFKQSVETYYRDRDNEYKNYAKDNYKDKEKLFRGEIRKRINDLKDNDKALNILKEELKKIYKTIDLLDDYDVMFLTTHKFLYPIYDPFNGSDYIYNFEKFKNGSISFLDEFDSQKNIFLDIEIEKVIEQRADYISIFLRIYDGLEHKEFFKKFGFKDEIESLKDNFKNIYKKNNLQYSYKLEDKSSGTDILFKDIDYFSIDRKYYTIKVDNDKQSNTIVSYNENGGRGVLDSLNDVIKLINNFIRLLYKIAEHYYIKYIDELEFSHAVSTILSEFNILKGDEAYQFLKDTIIDKNRIKSNSYKIWSKSSFYDRGFQYFSFNDTPNHHTKTTIDFKSFHTTPEKILANIAKNTFVVGISATALNRSVTSNFNLYYLKGKFPNNFFSLDKFEIDELRELYIKDKDDKLDNYAVKIIDCNYGENEIYELRQEALTIFGDIYEIEDWINTNNYLYSISRYFRIVKAYLEFTKNLEINSFLCLLTTYPKYNYSEYDKGISKIHLDKLLNIALKNRDEDKELYFIFDSKKDSLDKYENEIKPKLLNGEKIFVISTYQGLGIGKNIQYRVLDSKEDEIEKDFDAIYLDKPTFLLERIDSRWNSNVKNDKDKKLLKYIYQLEVLFSSGEISRDDLEKSIILAFKVTYNQSKENSKYKHSSTYDYLYSATKIIIQAVGRLHRTKYSDKKYIFIDKRLSFLNEYVEKSSFNLLSFDAIVNKCKTITSKKKFTHSFLDIIDAKNFKVNIMIKNTLNYKSSKHIKEWQDIREFVLKNPTLQNIEDMDMYELLYFEYNKDSFNKFPKYYYKQENDYSNIIDISFDKREEYIEVSMDNAKLNLIRDNKYLKEKFKESEYALFFDSSAKYIVTPIVYNNIYKGALGERVGKFLLEESGDLELLDLNNNEFEKFDYKSLNDVYIDFKYFGEFTGLKVNIDELISKAKIKLNSIPDAKKAIIINCFADNRYSDRVTHRDNISIYPYIITTNSQIKYEVIQSIIDEIKNAD